LKENVDGQGRKANRLIREKSPYLLQHAYNPVDWHPWGEEAFRKAAREDKPVFLSIGYSTCHWCHVMERESFEDEEVAELLNRSFVAVKVDREERPDVDQIYMAVCQALTGQGGWPLTVFLTPDRKPFLAGTYFPKRGRFGRIGLMDLLEHIERRWREDRETLVSVGDRLVEAIRGEGEGRKRAEGGTEQRAWDPELADKAYAQLEALFDIKYGGFGRSPKFPCPHQLMFLFRWHRFTGDERALEMAVRTLDGMARGGIRDHIGEGFARYSTDEQWLVPHFEKMLYDNALLAMAYTEAWQLTGEERHADAARGIFRYVGRDMTGAEGEFHSAEDADSEGEEGKFYLWTPAEAADVLGEDDARWFCELYGITEEGNFEGRSIPNLIGADPDAVARRAGMTKEELLRRAAEAREKLLARRSGRVRPHKDDKVLTSWNGLMIAAFAKAAAAFGEPAWAETARRAEAFLWRRLRREDGRLLARWRDGEAAVTGFVDDYAFYVWGLLELYHATFDAAYLERAVRLSREMIRLFWDEEEGGLYFYGADAEALIHRPKETYDGALPSGNSVAAANFVRMARLTGDETWASHAERLFGALAGRVGRYPAGHTMLLSAWLHASAPSREFVVVGKRGDPMTEVFLGRLQSRFMPEAVVLHAAPDGEDGEDPLFRIAPHVREYRQKNGKPTVYACENFACREPVCRWEDLEPVLDSR
jgi:hypothetical protein